MITRRYHKNLTTEIVKDKKHPVRKTHHKKQTRSSEENSEFEAEHIQAPVFNIHIHVPPCDGNNTTMMLPRIQPVIHIHFDELAKKLDVNNAVEKSSTYREVQNKIIRSPAKFSNITFHYSGNLTTTDDSDSNQEDCSTDQLSSKKKRNSNLDNSQQDAQMPENIKRDDESGSGTPRGSKTDCLRKKILSSDVNKEQCDRIFDLEGSKDNPKCYSDLIKKYKIKESSVVLTDFVKMALKCKNSGKKSDETNINLRNLNTIKGEHDYVITEPMHPQNFDKTCHVSGFADTDNDTNVNKVCSELEDIVTEEDYVADTSDCDDENDEFGGSINPCEVNKVKQKVLDDLEQDVEKDNDNLSSALSKQFNCREGETKNLQVSDSNENSQFRSKSLSPELNLLSVSKKRGGIYSAVYGSDTEEPTKSNNITVIAEKCNFSEILKNFKAEVSICRVSKKCGKIISNTNPDSPAVNNEEQICQKESVSRESMCSKKDSTYTFSVGSESNETQTTLNLRLGVSSENKVEPNSNSFFVQKENTPCRLKVIETHRLIDQTLFENSSTVCDLSAEFLTNQSSVENLQDNKEPTEEEDTVAKQGLISTKTGIIEIKDMDSNQTHSSEAKLMNPKSEKKMVNGNVTRTSSSSNLKKEHSPTKKRQLEVKNLYYSSSALKKMKSSQKQTQITSSKSSATEENYIPLKVSGPTKFAVAALDQLRSPLTHDARNFKNKMLYGNRVNRFSSSNELQLYKMKQMASRKSSSSNCN